MNLHPLRPAFEAINTSVGRGMAYIGLWFLGAILATAANNTLQLFSDNGIRRVDDGLNGGVLAFTLIAHPVGWLIIVSNIVIFPVFIRFKTSLWLLLIPLVCSLGYGLFILNEFN